jgi:hypothetical protein
MVPTMSSAALAVELRDEARRAELLRAIPKHWRRRVGAIHAGKMARAAGADCIAGRYAVERDADGWLAGVANSVGAVRVPVDISDVELCGLAERCASKALSMGEFAPGFFVSDKPALRARLAAFVASYGITPPAAYAASNSARGFSGIEDSPALARMTNSLWWRRALRREQGSQLERVAISLGYVHKKSEIYASNATVERRAQQRRRNALAMEQTEAVNIDTGEICNLAKLAAAGVANPVIRRGELMTRIAGFEFIAAGVGHSAEFVTITCPSVFHARRMVCGVSEVNPRYAGATPREAAQYLGRVWARIRAKLARDGVRVYGFRIAEPHGDGCPHWHLILFCEQEAVALVREVIGRYALALDGDEPGAAANRVKFVSIRRENTSKFGPIKPGSAAGYVAKYVSKNIDGGGVNVRVDLAGDPRYEPSQRVEAWASTWGIRQFQQIGGPPVGVWRELRRLPAGDYSPGVAAARAAADCGPLSRVDGVAQKTAEYWAAYVRVQGGPVVARRDLSVVLAKTAEGMRFDASSGAECVAEKNRYGELRAGAVYGVVDVLGGEIFASMRAQWEIRRGKNDVEIYGAAMAGGVAIHGVDVRVAAAGGNGAGGDSGSAVFLGVGVRGSRTRGNNCTDGGGNEFRKTGGGVECANTGGARCTHGAGFAGGGSVDFGASGGIDRGFVHRGRAARAVDRPGH